MVCKKTPVQEWQREWACHADSELLSEFHGWSNGAIRVRAIEPLGWFHIINFTPSKGKW